MIIDTLELVKQHLMKHEEITLSRYEYTAIRKEIEESVKQSASPTNTAITKCPNSKECFPTLDRAIRNS